MSQKNILIAAIVIVATAFVGFYMFSNQNANTPKQETVLSKKIETPEKNSQGEFVSTLVEFKVKSEKDKYTITYPRGKFKTDELGAELKKVLGKTDMGDGNKTSLVAGLIMNESFYVDTSSECGFDEPSSAWCMRITNDKTAKTVETIVQKGKFEARTV